MPKVYKYRIHPAIGVARLGNSVDSFDGPEIPEQDFLPTGGNYRDGAGNIRRQAAVFRIYEYEYPNAVEAAKVKGMPSKVREITMNAAKIEWKVKLANRKARNNVGGKAPIVPVPPEQALNTKNHATIDVKGDFANGIAPAVSVLLGQLSTDGVGRLRVLAGMGVSDSPGIPHPVPPGADLANYKENDGWYDDIADGPIMATVDFSGFPNPPPGVAGPQKVESAWLVTAAPDYAHAVESIVSLYDLAYTIAVVHFQLPSNKSKPSFTHDVYPILHKAAMAHWTSDLLHVFYANPVKRHHFEEATFGNAAFRKTGADKFKLLKEANKTLGSAERVARENVFNRLRNPVSGGGGNMPRLNQDTISAPKEKLALTQLYYKQLKKWAEGEFNADWVGPLPVVTPLSALPPEKQPEALDQAHMRSMVGGAFFPGIEVGENVRLWKNWNAPFRIKDTLPAGTLTETLAMPWQADFSACEREDGDEWWPSHRPITVLPGTETDYDVAKFKEWAPFSMIEMVSRWKELGFLKKKVVGADTLYVQREPNSPP